MFSLYLPQSRLGLERLGLGLASDQLTNASVSPRSRARMPRSRSHLDRPRARAHPCKVLLLTWMLHTVTNSHYECMLCYLTISHVVCI